MFKLILRLFIPLFVVRSVSCLQCYQTHSWKCQWPHIDKWFFECLEFYSFTKCESHKLCLKGELRAPQVSNESTFQAPLRGCGLTQDCMKLMHDVLDPYVSKITSNLTVIECQSCSERNLCNVFDPRLEKRITRQKALRGFKNSTSTTDAPSKARPAAKKNVGSRSHSRIAIHQMLIFLHNILLLLSKYF